MINIQPFTPRYFQLPGIQAQLVQNGRMNIGDVMTIFHGMETDFIGRPMRNPPLESRPGHPDRKPEDMMVAAIGTLGAWRATEFAGKNHQRLVQQSAAMQVLQESTDRLVNCQRVGRVVILQATMRILSACSSRTMLDLDEADTPFNKSPGRK